MDCGREECRAVVEKGGAWGRRESESKRGREGERERGRAGGAGTSAALEPAPARAESSCSVSTFMQVPWRNMTMRMTGVTERITSVSCHEYLRRGRGSAQEARRGQP